MSDSSAPTDGQTGRAGAIEALEALADAYGPGYAEVNEQAAERLREDSRNPA